MKIELFKIKLESLKKDEALNRFCDLMNKKSSSIVCTVNVEFIERAKQSDRFKYILNQKSSLNLIDGVGIIWAYTLLNSKKPKINILKHLYIHCILLKYNSRIL